MWVKYIFIFFIFYFLAVLQNDFFAHFNLFGAIPNLVFVIFFMLIFFTKKRSYYEVFFYAISAGLFLDFFSYTYFGVSIISLLIIGFIVKKIQDMLQEKKNDKFPFVYFLPLFLGSLIVYNFLSSIFISKFYFGSVPGIIYNLLIACLAFFAFKKFLNLGFDDRQLNLFEK